jgi:hypothetical protein
MQVSHVFGQLYPGINSLMSLKKLTAASLCMVGG